MVKKTKTIRNTDNPKWFYTADFPIDIINSPNLQIEVFDHDHASKTLKISDKQIYRISTIIRRRYIYF